MTCYSKNIIIPPQKDFKTAREKGQITCKARSIKKAAPFDGKFKVQMSWKDLFKVLKDHNCQLRSL